MIKIVSGVQIIYDNTNQNQSENIIHGTGSIFTIVATGAAGQTAKVQGSIDGDIWIDIVNFEIESAADFLSTVQQFSFPYLKVTGNAAIKIARGSA